MTGNSISSPTMFVGFGSDWRKTIRRHFADENMPKLAPEADVDQRRAVRLEQLGSHPNWRSTTLTRNERLRISSTAICRAAISTTTASPISTWILIGVSISSGSQVQVVRELLPCQRAKGGPLFDAVCMVRRGFQRTATSIVPRLDTSYTSQPGVARKRPTAITRMSDATGTGAGSRLIPARSRG